MTIENNICNGCPRFGKVCDGEMSTNRKFCFIPIENNESVYIQFDKLSKLVEVVIAIENTGTQTYKPECCELTKHCTDDFFLLKLKPVEKGADLVGVGFVKVRGVE